MNGPRSLGPIAHRNMSSTFSKLTSKYWIGMIPVIEGVEISPTEASLADLDDRT